MMVYYFVVIYAVYVGMYFMYIITYYIHKWKRPKGTITKEKQRNSVGTTQQFDKHTVCLF